MVQEVARVNSFHEYKVFRGGRMAKTSIKRVAVEIPEDLGIHLSELEEGLQVKSALRLYEKSMVSSSQARRVAGLTRMGSGNSSVLWRIKEGKAVGSHMGT